MSDERRDPVYVLNVNPAGRDVLHRDPRETCNTDDAKGRETIDATTADALLTSGGAIPCRHCYQS